MKFPIAALGLVCLARDVVAFAPPSRTALPVPTTYFDASPLMAVPDQFEEDSQVPSAVSKMTNQAASVFAASVISASTLGLATVSTLPPPAFAAPAAKVETVAKKVETVTKKVAPEVTAVDTAKQAAASAAKTLSAAQSKIPTARTAVQAASKELSVAESSLKNAKKTADAAKERVKSLSANTKAFDQKTITTAEGRVSKYWWLFVALCYCRVLWQIGVFPRSPFLRMSAKVTSLSFSFTNRC